MRPVLIRVGISHISIQVECDCFSVSLSISILFVFFCVSIAVAAAFNRDMQSARVFDSKKNSFSQFFFIKRFFVFVHCFPLFSFFRCRFAKSPVATKRFE